MTDEFVQFAQKALIIKNNKLLIIKKSAKDINSPNQWEVPGGRKQVGENLEQHIIREVKEEVGLYIQPKEIFDMWEFSIPVNNEKTTVVAIARFCELTNDTIVITEDEIDNYKWVAIDEKLLDYNLIPGIRKTIEKLVNKFSK